MNDTNSKSKSETINTSKRSSRKSNDHQKNGSPSHLVCKNNHKKRIGDLLCKGQTQSNDSNNYSYSDDENKRYDRRGIEINPKNKKKIKITFNDDVMVNQPLVDVIPVESYKKYNYVGIAPPERAAFEKTTNCCQSCNIF